MTSKQRVDGIYALIKKYKDDEVIHRLLSNGFVPEGLQEELETIADSIPVGDNDNSDYYKSQFSTWFAEHPEKIVGKEVEGSGYISPVKTIGKIDELDTVIPNEGTEQLTTKINNHVFKRSAQTEHRGSDETNSREQKAAIHIRRSIETARKKFKGQEITEREKLDLESKSAFNYAKENDLWVKDLYSLGNHFVGGGNENTLAYDEDKKVIYKSNNLFNSNHSILQLLEQVENHNKLFPETKYVLVGFTGIDNGENKTPYVEPIFKQDYVINSEQTSPEEIINFMQLRGFKELNSTTFTNGEYTISDLHPRNVLKKDGVIYVVDDIVTKNRLSEKEIEDTIKETEKTETMKKDNKEPQIGEKWKGKRTEQTAVIDNIFNIGGGTIYWHDEAHPNVKGNQIKSEFMKHFAKEKETEIDKIKAHTKGSPNVIFATMPKAEKKVEPIVPAKETTYERLKKVFPSLKQNHKGYYIPSSANDPKYIVAKANAGGIGITIRSMENDGTDLYDVYITETYESSMNAPLKEVEEKVYLKDKGEIVQALTELASKSSSKNDFLHKVQHLAGNFGIDNTSEEFVQAIGLERKNPEKNKKILSNFYLTQGLSHKKEKEAMKQERRTNQNVDNIIDLAYEISARETTESIYEPEIKEEEAKKISIESKTAILRVEKGKTTEHKELLTIEDTLAMYSSHIPDAEIKGWVYYKRLFGNPMRGWEKFYLTTTSVKETLVYSKTAFYLKDSLFRDVTLVPSDTMLGRKTKFKNEYDDKTYVVIRNENNELYYCNSSDIVDKEIGGQTSEAELKELVKQKGICYKDGEYVPISIYTMGNIYDIKDALLGKYSSETNKIEGGYYQTLVDMFGLDVAEWHKQIIEDAIKIKGEYYFDDAIPSKRPFINGENPISTSFQIKELNPDSGVDFEKLYEANKKRADRWKKYDYETSYSLFAAYQFWFEVNITDAHLVKTTRKNIIDYYFNNRNISGDLTPDEKDELKLNARDEGEKFYCEFLATALTPNDIKGLNIHFNRTYNSVCKLNTDNIPVAFETNNRIFNSDFKLKPVQRNGIAFLSAASGGCLAHDVGFGKTLEFIHLLASLLKQGAIKRPLIAVPKPTYNNIIREMFGYYDDGIEKRFEPFEGAVFINGALTGTKYKLNKWYNLNNKIEFKNELVPEETITIVTYEGFGKIGFSEKLHEELFEGLFSILSRGKTTKEPSERDVQKQKENIRQMLGIGMADTVVDIDVCGFDYLGLDEAHAFKNVFNGVPLDKGQTNVWRLTSKASPTKRAVKAFFNSLYIQKKYNGNVCLLTATPFTNSPLEIFSMLSLVGYETLGRYNLQNLYEFLGMFIQTEVEYTVNHLNVIELSTVVKSFKNKNLLKDILYRHFDYQDNPALAGVKRPCKLVFPNNQVNTYLSQSVAQMAGQSIVREEAANYDPRNNKGAMGRALMWAKNNAFSPFLIEDVEMYKDLEEFVNESPKIKYTIECIKSVKEYHESIGQEVSGQVIYTNRGKSLLPDFKNALEEMCDFKKGVKFGDSIVDEVEIITGGGSDKELEYREVVKDAFNAGYVKVIIGTDTIKEGINLQNRGTVLYNLDLNWNPTDFVQLGGRIHRQGNRFKYVRIVVPLVQNTLDSFINQKLDEKGKRISSLWDKDNGSNTLDEFAAVDPIEIKFALIDDENELLKMTSGIEKEKAAKAVTLAKDKHEAIAKLSSAISDYKEALKDITPKVATTLENHIKYVGYLNKYVLTGKADKKSVEDLLVKLNENIVLFKDANDNKNIKSLIEAFRNLRVKTYTFKTKDDGAGTKEYSDLVEIYTKQSFYGDLVEYNDWTVKSFTSYYGDMKRLERQVLQPYGLTVDDNFTKIIKQFKNELETAENEVEFLDSVEYKEKAIHEIRAKLKKRAAERGTIEERVAEFASFNHLLSYPFDKDTADHCELPKGEYKYKDEIHFNKKVSEAQISDTPEDLKTDTENSVAFLKDKLSDIQDFMPVSQYKLVKSDVKEFEEIILRLHKLISTMPKVGDAETDNVYLHYFTSGSDWFIKEKDSVKNEPQHQAFGYAVLNGDWENAEYGYISIEELRQHKMMQLDFHFAPKELSEALNDIGKPKGVEVEEPAEHIVDTETETDETKEAIAMLEELLPTLKGKVKKETIEAIQMLKEL
jgi:hypothetical protein